MRAHIGALVALDALGDIPFRHGNGHAALLVCRGALLELAVHIFFERRNRQAVAVHLAHGEHHLRHHVHGGGVAGQVVHHRRVLRILPRGGHFHLVIGVKAGVNGLPVHFHNGLALLREGFFGRVLHIFQRILFGQHTGQRKESRLQDGVGALAKADFDGFVDGVDGVKLNIVLRNIALGFGRHVFIQLFICPLAVDEEHAARLHVVHHLVALDDVRGVVAGHKIRLVNVVRSADGLVAKAQVADGDAAGLLRIVLEVCLNIFVGVVANNLGAVLVGTHRAVAAKAPELALFRALCSRVGRGFLFQREVGDVVCDANGEAGLRGILRQFFIHGKHAGGRGVLRAQAIAAADNGGLAPCFGKGAHHVQVQRLGISARLLRAVQHGDLLRGGGHGGQ